MSIAQVRRRRFWSRVGRLVKGFGRAFAIKKLTAEYDAETAGMIVKRYESNQRVRA